MFEAAQNATQKSLFVEPAEPEPQLHRLAAWRADRGRGGEPVLRLVLAYGHVVTLRIAAGHVQGDMSGRTCRWLEGLSTGR